MLLSLATVAGVLVATVRLARRRLLPVPARWLAAAIGAYGIAAFVLGVSSHTGYAALFHGEAAWSRLPTVLQGAILGSFLIVPLALVLEIFDAVRV